MVGRPRKGRGALPGPLARALGRTPFVSDEDAIAWARHQALTAVEHGEPKRAEQTARELLTARPSLAADDLVAGVVAAILATGREPALLREAVAALLAAADRHLTQERVRASAASFAQATKLAFDRSVHFDTTTSPLARDPRGFNQPIEASSIARALRAPRGRTRSGSGAREAQPPRDRPQKVVVATRGNDNFLRELLDMLAADDRFDYTFVDFSGDEGFSRGIRNTARVAEEILGGGTGMAARVEARLRPLLDGTDVLFVEWCTALAVLVGLVDPGDTRVVVRLHSFEAFTHWPHLLDFGRIDDMVFVSAHLRDFAVDAIPGLREDNAPRLHVLPLARQLRQYERPKVDSARFTIGLVGWGSVAKDPAWALEVLKKLRQHDDRYRLLLVGADFDTGVSPAAANYAQEMSIELAELERSGAVVRAGETGDVPSALTDIGVILSSSVRESFHAALVEGAASAAIPVVRDWPFFAGRRTSARTLFPEEWMVATPEEGAERILALTADAATWREAGAAASEHAVATWDWSVVRPSYERLFRGA